MPTVFDTRPEGMAAELHQLQAVLDEELPATALDRDLLGRGTCGSLKLPRFDGHVGLESRRR